MEFKIRISKEAEKTLSKNKKLFQESMKKFYEYARDPYSQYKDVSRIEGKKNLFRMKINSDFRALFTLKSEIITIYVFHVGSRGDIYNKLKNL